MRVIVIYPFGADFGGILKGIIVFYINFLTAEDQKDSDATLNMVRNQNKELHTKLAEAGYDMIFVPCVKEACRVEKVDFDQPYPRFIPNYIDVTKVQNPTDTEET